MQSNLNSACEDSIQFTFLSTNYQHKEQQMAEAYEDIDDYDEDDGLGMAPSKSKRAQKDKAKRDRKKAEREKKNQRKSESSASTEPTSASASTSTATASASVPAMSAALADPTRGATKTETAIAAQAAGDVVNAVSVTTGSVIGAAAEKIAEATEAEVAREDEQDKKGKKKGKGMGKDKEKKTGKAKGTGKGLENASRVPKLVERVDNVRWKILPGFVPHMRTEVMFYATEVLAEQIFSEYNDHSGSMLPALQQLGNVAALPGIVGCSLGMPDLHSGYGFAIGNVAAIDMSHPDAVVVPGGVGFDINCGVRLLRTNLTEADVQPVKEKLNHLLFKEVPLGVSADGGLLSVTKKALDEVLNRGMEFLLEKGVIWPEDIQFTEEGGRIKLADASKVSDRAKARGLNQVGSLGSGNHYMEIQVVDEIFDAEAAAAMGLKLGGVCVMIHSGSRGLGHQVCSDYLQQMQTASGNLAHPNDRQLTGVKINSPLGQNYLAGMSAAANFAFCNRSMMMAKARECFEQIFKKTAKELDMHMVYDVAHNIAKVEKHVVKGQEKTVLVHRKGATRAFAPGHPEIPAAYSKIGQPILIGGSMGTASYVLTGTKKAMEETFGSTCHGAGRVLSRGAALRELSSNTVLQALTDKGISVKVGTKKLVAEEAPESYKDVSEVVQTCHNADISKLCVKLRPMAVIKG